MIAGVSGRASAAPTAVRGPALYATTGVSPRILEICATNTTNVACTVALARVTTNPTPGTALTEVGESDPSQTPIATAFNTHGADATMGTPFRWNTLGAAAGSGAVWTFVDGLLIPNLANNGIAIICPTGTGQVIDFYFSWRE